MARGSRASSPARETKSAGSSHSKLLKDVLEPVRTSEDRITISPIKEVLSFDKGFYVFVRALQLLKSQNEGVILVGLGGASGSGKTAFSHKIQAFMPGVVVISMDMYNDGSKVVDQNFDDPRLTDYDCLLANLSDLKAGRETQVPIYDFKISKRVGHTPTPVPPSRVIILEGIYALNERLRPLLDLRVSITGGVHFDLVKRVMRDITRSGQGPEAIIQQVTETVYPMYKAFIEPDLQTAQLRIHNTFNPFAGFMHPTYILKSAAVPELSRIRQALQALGAEVTEASDKDLADIYLLPPGEDPETCQTWLRMRNKEGRYTLMFEEWVMEGPFIISPRITFEVSVKILGGLMALGYEIGTIMRRTSHIFKLPSCDVTVKVDEVTNLGRFIQLLGRERDLVARLGKELGLEGTYIARPYIEQVQLEKLVADFTAVTAEVKEELAKGAAAPGKVLMDILAASPPARIPARITRRWSSANDHSLEALSSSAPPDAPLHSLGPSPHQAAAALTGVERSGASRESSALLPPAAAGGSETLQGSGGVLPPAASAGRPASGLLHQQLHASSSSSLAAGLNGGGAGSGVLLPPASPAPSYRTQVGFSPGPALLPPSGQPGGRDGAQAPPIRAARSTNCLRDLGGSENGSGGANGSLHSGHDAALASASLARVVDSLDAKLQRIGASAHQYSEIRAQLDVLVEQYHATNSQLQALTEATAGLAASMQAALATVAERVKAATAAQPTPGTPSWLGTTLSAWAPAAAVAAVAMVAVWAIRSAQRGGGGSQ